MREVMEQYLLTMGIKNVNELSDEFLSEFYEWIIEYKKIGDEYLEFLNYLDFNYEDSRCVEFGKGKFDSLVIPFKTKIITKDKSIKGVNQDRIINGSLKVCYSEPLLIEDNKVDILSNKVFDIHTFITQNPTSVNKILGLEDLHNSGFYNIILGIYGNNNDKNKNDKINLLKKIKERLNDLDYKDEYASFNGNYYYAIGSLRKRLYKNNK